MEGKLHKKIRPARRFSSIHSTLRQRRKRLTDGTIHSKMMGVENPGAGTHKRKDCYHELSSRPGHGGGGLL